MAAAVPRNVQEVVEECVDRLGDNLRAVLWHGSRARGEGGDTSDDDVILILRRIDDGVLLSLREMFFAAGRGKWSSYALSEAEFQKLPINKRFRFAHGFQVLHGDFEPLSLSREEVLAYLRSCTREVVVQSRNRLIHKNTSLPIMYRVAKFAVFAMKARHLLHSGHWPETRAELLPLIEDPNERTVIDWVERWAELSPEFKRDPVSFLLHVDAVGRRIIGSLPEA